MNKQESKYKKALWNATIALQDEKQMENGLASCLNILVETIGCENGFVWIYDERDSRLYIVACTGKADVTGVSVNSHQGILGYTFNNQEYVVIHDATTDVRFSTNEDEETGYKTKTMLTVPLKTPTGVYGCVQLINKIDGRFDPEDLKISKNIAALSAMDIEDKGYIVNIMTKEKPIISLKNVTKEYKSGESTVQILKGIDLDIYEGEFLVILGESGCGKTTMLNIIGGMDSLTEGSLEIDGKDFAHPSDAQLTDYRKDYIGFIFQSYNLMPNLSAIENVEFIAENSKEPLKSIDAIKLVGLEERADNFPSQMSGGQQQRVSIGRAVVKNPDILMCDEPTGALDYNTSKEILALIEDCNKKYGSTIIMVTHNEAIKYMADHVEKLRDGVVRHNDINENKISAFDLEW